MNAPPVTQTKRGHHVVVVGLGNIGSPLVEMLARTDAVGQLTLVDRDSYESSNLLRQAIQPEDVGKPKAVAQAERARRIRPGMRIEALHAAVEDVPPGRLRGDAILSGLDSKISRQHLNERVWRLGIPWVDAGVAADDLLARINVYVPGPDGPCLECAWDERDYETLEVRRPCQAGNGSVPTGAPAFLGSLAAALLMTECTKILAGDWTSVKVGRQITLAAAAHKLHEMVLCRNANCRFDHGSCEVQAFPCDPAAVPLGTFVSCCKDVMGEPGSLPLQVQGRHFDRRLQCACGEVKPVFCLAGRMPPAEKLCPRCGAIMSPAGFARLAVLNEEALSPEDRGKTLSSLGLALGDLIMTRSGGGWKAVELAPVRRLEES